jgi:signal transduction histidine kinase
VSTTPAPRRFAAPWRETGRALLSQGRAVLRLSEPRQALTRRAVITDLVIAAVALVLALIAVHVQYNVNPVLVVLGPGGGPAYPVSQAGGLPGNAIVAALTVSVPLAARRRFPLSAFLVMLAGALITSRYATDFTFLAVIFAAYSAIACSRFRGAALVFVPMAGLAVAAVFWATTPASHVSIAQGPAGLRIMPVRLQGVGPATPWRGPGLLVLVSIVLIAIIGNAVRAREARDRLQAEHEAQMRQAVEQERARIASELHDVVTHNVSVMIVQAGAARQVLAETPDQARAALLAVEASGRAAMTELRYLLGLLSPGGAGTGPESEAELRPQPGLDRLQALISRVGATGLPVTLEVGELPPGLPPGLDLAAYRVVQEALTNVIKHAGKPATTVRLTCAGGDLVVEVANAAPPIPAAMPAVPGSGRGLLGLRERVALYGGELAAGPAGDGWVVLARLPASPQPAELSSAR